MLFETTVRLYRNKCKKYRYLAIFVHSNTRLLAFIKYFRHLKSVLWINLLCLLFLVYVFWS